ncbi:MAG: DUF6152 family protein [Acidobacteriota bacterium]
MSSALYSLGMTYGNRIILSAAVALLLSVSAVAHHGSSVSYQLDKTITVTGTVTEWAFINPHPQIYFDTHNEGGEVAHWAAELLPTPLMLKNMQAGWSRTTMKPGDQIQLVCNPSRVAGAKACLAKGLQVNGKAWPLAAGGAGAPKGKQ